jgi:hypothetical protein
MTATDPGFTRARTRPQAGRAPRSWLRAVDAVVGVALSLAVLAVHPLHYMLRTPYWFDEQWVAVSTRVSITKLALVSCVSPVGFTFLIRLVPGTGPERFRLVVLFLAAGAVGTGYLLGRELRLAPVVTGTLVGGAVLLAPMFSRVISLKPYMGDALVTLLMFLLLARLESRWTRRRLIALATTGALLTLVSNGALFVTPSVLAALFIATAARRQWRRVVEVTVAGAASGAAMGIVFLVFVARHQNPSLEAFWSDFFVPTDTSAYDWTLRRLEDIAPFLGTRHVPVIVALAVLGLATLVRLERYALALAAPLLVLVAIAASAAQRYPFLDLRTSIFWLVAVVVLMAVGVAGVIAALARLHLAVAAVALIAVGATWIHQTQPYFAAHTIKYEPLRAEVRYLDAHREPGDVVLVSFPALWGYAFYERAVQISVIDVPEPDVGFPDFRPVLHDRDTVVARSRDPRAIRAAFASARRRVAAARDGARLWIVLSHTQKHEQRAWRAALAGTDARFLIRTPGRFEGLLVLTNVP